MFVCVCDRRPQISFSDDEEEEKRVVRSQKDKRYALLENKTAL